MLDLVGNPEGRFSYDAAQMHMYNLNESLYPSLVYTTCKKMKTGTHHLSEGLYYRNIPVVTKPYCEKTALSLNKHEPRHEKTGFLHMRKQRHRSAVR